jgi:hypothetical protein
MSAPRTADVHATNAAERTHFAVDAIARFGGGAEAAWILVRHGGFLTPPT